MGEAAAGSEHGCDKVVAVVEGENTRAFVQAEGSLNFLAVYLKVLIEKRVHA